MVIHKLQFLFTKSTVTLYRQREIEQKQPVQMARTPKQMKRETAKWIASIAISHDSGLH
jgi:hypothetical protein